MYTTKILQSSNSCHCRIQLLPLKTVEKTLKLLFYSQYVPSMGLPGFQRCWNNLIFVGRGKCCFWWTNTCGVYFGKSSKSLRAMSHVLNINLHMQHCRPLTPYFLYNYEATDRQCYLTNTLQGQSTTVLQNTRGLYYTKFVMAVQSYTIY